MGKLQKVFPYLYAKIKFSGSSLGNRVFAFRKLSVKNPKYMTIGNYCWFGPGCRIEAWDKYNDKTYKPKIVIGNEVKINSTCHIGAINHVEIGDQTLLGSHVMIMDHSHGSNSYSELSVAPTNRDLYSKGEVVIGKRCWICENAVILPNVHIGDGCIIGANCVVTKDVPANCVVAGNPGRIVKEIKPE